MTKQYVSIGNWHFKGGERGLTLASFENGTLTPINSFYPQINVGMQTVDTERKIIYLVEETGGGEARTGGAVAAVKYDLEKETLTLLNKKPTHGVNTSYCALDSTGKYLIAVHHDEGTPEGDHDPHTSAIVLFRIEEDGSIGDLIDFYEIKGETNPHVHSVYESPDHAIYIMNDKGLDRVYAFRLDREAGKLIFLNECLADPNTASRYGIFHPTLPIFYGNNERAGFLYKYTYDDNGLISRSEPISLFDGSEEAGQKVEPSDVAMTSDGRFLYAAIRGINRIVSYRIKEDGDLIFLASTPCGNGPRGIETDPANRYLLSCNLLDHCVEIFTISENGIPEHLQNSPELPVPGNLCFLK